MTVTREQEQLGRRQQAHPRGGELQRKWNTVQPPADSRNGDSLTGTGLETGQHRARPLEEEARRGVPQEVDPGIEVIRREVECGNAVKSLAVDG